MLAAGAGGAFGGGGRDGKSGDCAAPGARRLGGRGRRPGRTPAAATYDAVVLAVPGPAAARLLAGAVARRPRPRPAVLDYASVALVTLACARRHRRCPGAVRLPRPAGPRARGQGGDVLSASGRGAGGRRGLMWCGPRSGGTARRRCCSADDARARRVALADLAGRLAAPVPRPGDPGGPVGRRAAAVRRRATSTGWPDPRRASRSPPRPGGLRARRTTGVGIPACVAIRRRPPPTRSARLLALSGRMSAWTESKRPNAGAKAAASSTPTIRYTMWSVFRLARAARRRRPGRARPTRSRSCSTQLAGKDVVVRGIYDVAGPARRRRPDGLVARRDRRRAAGGLPPVPPHDARPRACDPVWSQMALHRPAEFNKSHVPAFLADEEPRALRLRLPVRALLRVVPAARRGAPRACSPSTARWPAATPTCGPTRSPSFALGDYEWMLAFEADELHRIVDLMRHLRGSRGPAARARGGAVLHRAPPHADRRAGRRPAVSVASYSPGSRVMLIELMQ